MPRERNRSVSQIIEYYTKRYPLFNRAHLRALILSRNKINSRTLDRYLARSHLVMSEEEYVSMTRYLIATRILGKPWLERRDLGGQALLESTDRDILDLCES